MNCGSVGEFAHCSPMSKRLKTHLSFTNQTRTATTATIALRLTCNLKPPSASPGFGSPLPGLAGRLRSRRASRSPDAPAPAPAARPAAAHTATPAPVFGKFDFREPPRGPGAAWRRTSLRPPARGARPARTARPPLQRRTCPQRRETTPTRRRPRGPGAARAARTDRCGPRTEGPQPRGRRPRRAGRGVALPLAVARRTRAGRHPQC